jgi:WD40 repeat protein
MREPREVVHLIDAATGQLIRSIRNDGVGRDIPERTWSQDSRFFALSSSKIRTTTSLEELMLDLGGSSQQPRSIEVRDGQTGHVVSTIASLGEQVDLAGFTPQSDAVWVVKRRCDIRLVRIGEPRLLWTSEANQRIDELAIGPDGTLVAAVLGIYLDERKAIRTMHAESGKTSNEIQLDSGACRLYFRTGTELIVSCADGTVRLYDADKATETKRFRDHVRKSNREEVPLTLMAVSPDGGVVVTATGEDAIAPVVARDLRHNTRKPLAKSKSTEARCIAVSLDGEKFAYSDSGGESFVILRRTGRVIVRGDRPVTVRAVAISIDEQRNRLIVLGAFGELQIFDLQNGQMEAPHTITLLNPEYGLDTGIILPESNLVIAAEERLVQIVDLDSRKATYLQGRDVYAMPPLATSPDGGLLAAASPDGAVGLWRTGDGRRVSILRRHRAGVSALRFSRDGGRLISADVEGLVCAWDVTDASLRGAALTEWIQTRTGRGLLVLDESDDDNLLLRDLLNDAGSTSRDLIEALGRFRQVSNSTSNLR